MPRGHPLPRPRIEPLLPEPDHIIDPANGAQVSRCWSCGRPEIGRRIYVFPITLGGRTFGVWKLCGDCITSRNPQPDPDPLTA